ncbi:unnamed protein product [Blepharisma stoltei]|uniref:Uncharacterized protein n=1 Tax=Blepharisma stoltei TaxID=1481888 RepID=A0AAU9J1K5_9CILI|nr:unnamed protein product [Blepharisma stoltei]
MEQSSRAEFKSRNSQLTLESEQEIIHLKKENSELINTLTELRCRIQSLQKQNENLQKSNTGFQEQINKLIYEEQESFNAKIQITMELSECRKELAEKCKENEAIKQGNLDAKEIIEKLKERNEEVRKRNAELESLYLKTKQQLEMKNELFEKQTKGLKEDYYFNDFNLKRSLNFQDNDKSAKRIKKSESQRFNFDSPISDRSSPDLQNLLDSYKCEIIQAKKTIKNMKNDVKRLLGWKINYFDNIISLTLLYSQQTISLEKELKNGENTYTLLYTEYINNVLSVSEISDYLYRHTTYPAFFSAIALHSYKIGFAFH